MGTTPKIKKKHIQQAIDADGAFVVEVHLSFVVTHAAHLPVTKANLAGLIDDLRINDELDPFHIDEFSMIEVQDADGAAIQQGIARPTKQWAEIE